MQPVIYLVRNLQLVEAAQLAIQASGISGLSLSDLKVGAGIAGVNIHCVMSSMQRWEHPFASFALTTDLHIACLGAHEGQDGAIIITGTGSSGVSIVNNQYCELGGHGFVAGDKGSGAWLGKKALSHALEVMDKLAPDSALASAVVEQLECKNTQDVVKLTIEAKPAFYARLAPLVLSLAVTGEPTAKSLVTEGAEYIDKLARRLLENKPPRLSIIGGVSQNLLPWLSDDVQNQMQPPLNSPEYGAIIFAKSH